MESLKRTCLLLIVLLGLLAGCDRVTYSAADYPESDRRGALPADIQKRSLQKELISK